MIHKCEQCGEIFEGMANIVPFYKAVQPFVTDTPPEGIYKACFCSECFVKFKNLSVPNQSNILQRIVEQRKS